MNDTKQKIMDLARLTVQAHGYSRLSFRELAKEIGIKSASIHHHFPTKGDLGAALARRYWEDIVVDLESLSSQSADPVASLRRYPEIFRKSLMKDNRMCLCSYMAAEYDDLPDPVKKEVLVFTDVNVAWLSKILVSAGVVAPAEGKRRAQAIYAAVAGAQLIARSRSDIGLFDELMGSYRAAGLLPG